MKLIKLLALTVTLGVGLSLAVSAAESSAKKAKAAPGKVLHVVAFKFKDTATPEQIKQVETAFSALPKKIKQIQSFEWGTNISPEKLDKGFTHGYVLSFKNDQDRDAYLVHPDHKAFGGIVGPVLADVFVIDFRAQK
jgi:hypothetical protein